MSTIRIRARVQGDVAEVRALVRHPMETGTRKDKKTGNAIPAHFIKQVKCEHNGNTVMTANWSVTISTNPYLAFDIKGAKAGDKVKISWDDNNGKSDSAEADIG
ncbi:MAG: thiosulfate oxidation carrier complex protein SoxZ [Thiohalomonadaceae bacterium]